LIELSKSRTTKWKDIENPVQMASNSKPFPERRMMSWGGKEGLDHGKNIGDGLVSMSQGAKIDIDIETNDFEFHPKFLLCSFPWASNFIPEHEETGL
jgi:hypothetical protein